MQMALSAGVSFAISAVVSQISKWIHAQEEARQNAVELSNTYKEQQSSLDSQIKKYKELKTELDRGNLTADETRSIKEQLLGIQESLVDSYGDEVSNLDLVNGKYKDQLGLLTELSKEKAIEHTVKNRDVYEEAKEALSEEKTYNLGQYFTRPFYASLTDEQNKLNDFINNYDSSIKLVSQKSGVGYAASGAITKGSTLQVQGDAESVYNLLQQFSEDLRNFGDKNGIDVTNITSNVSSQLRTIWTDELQEYKTVYDEFVNAEIMRNDTLRPLYHDSIQAVKDYNAALASGEGVSEAKANLDSIKESIQGVTGQVEGSSEVFEGIFDEVNSTSEKAYNIGQLFENDTTVQNYAEQLRGLSDIDLKSFNFNDDFIAPGEEAFSSLINVLGLSEDETQLLIDKLIELGYVQGSISSESSPLPTISETISLISTQLKPQFDSLSDAYQKIFTPDGFTKENIDNDMLENLRSTFSNLDESLGISFDTSELEDFFSILTNSKSTSEQVQKAFNDLATSYLYSTDVMDQLNETTADSIEKQLEEMGVSNAQTLVAEALNFKNEELIASKQFLAKRTKELSDATGSEIAKFGVEQLAANNCSEALALFYLQKSLLNSKVISSDEDINNILRLAEAAGVTSSSLALLQSAKADYNRAIEMGDDAAAQRAEQRVLKASEQLKQDVAKLKPHVNVNTGNTSASNNVKSAGTAGKEDTDPHVTAFEEQYKKLKDIRDRDKISQKQYLDALRAMYERYYKGQDKYIDEYNKYQKEYLDGMLDLYKSVISGVVKQIDKHIKSLNDQKDSAVDSLKSQQESAKKALEAQKDAIEEQIKLIDKQIDSKQAQIDAINEENEARENAINLEKEQYELERLRNQRTEFVYSGKEKGFIYQTDSGAIRDQEQAVKEAEDQIRIANIEKEISLLEKKKEVLEEQLDAYYEELISNTESYWDTQIKGAEDVKSRWEELQDLKEQLELNVQLISMGISPDDISQLTSEELFEKVKEHYLGILADISSGNSQMLSSLSDLAGVDVSDLPSFLEETHGYMEKLSEGIDFANLDDSLSTVIDQFENVAAAAGMMTGSVIGSTGVSVGTDKSTKSSPGGSASGNVSFIDAVKSLEDESVPMLNNVADAFAGEESSDNSSQSIAGSVNKAKEAIAGSSSGKKKSSEGQEGSGEDSGSLLEAMSVQSKAALDEETGIPAQIQKWQELNGVLSNILENLRNIAAVIPTLNSDTNISAPGASAAGLAAAKGGVFNGARNVLVSEYNQLETIIHKNGTYEITSSPTLTDLRPGDQVLNNSQTLSLIRTKNRAAANRSNGLFIGNSLSPLPELQLRNTVLDHSFASPMAPQFLSNDNRNSLVNVSIGDVILENVQNADALSRQIVMRLPTQIKQELSKRG